MILDCANPRGKTGGTVYLYCPGCLVSRISVFTSRIPVDRETSQDDFFYDIYSTTKRKCHPKLEGLDVSKPPRYMPKLKRTPEN